MQIGGLQKQTLIDYPGHLAPIIFTNGCNFRCPYCYNKSLVEGTANLMPVEKVFSFLKERQNLLDGVVVTGGEPTLQKDLLDFLEKIKDLGYDIKLDTNGSNPEKLAMAINQNLVDYIAMDIKGPIEKYDKIAGVKIDKDKIKKSVELIKEFSHHEFRTTVAPSFLKEEDFKKIARWLKGAQKYYLQQLEIKETMIDPRFQKETPYPSQKLKSFVSLIEDNFKECEVRGIE